MTALENPLRALAGVRPVGVARLHPPQPDHERRAPPPDRRRRPAGRDLQPGDLRKGHRGQLRLPDILEAPDARALDPKTLYEQLAVRDIQDAADALRGVYERTDARDGYVSLEVSPLLAYDTAGTLDEARRLWRAVGRENLMIKVPATRTGHARRSGSSSAKASTST